jgi:hypothetical protein
VKLLSSTSLSREINKYLYISLKRLVILYGSETWALRKSDENKFITLERKISQQIKKIMIKKKKKVQLTVQLLSCKMTKCFPTIVIFKVALVNSYSQQ